MISLTPIAKKIQKKLFEKMEAFGRVSNPNAPSPASVTLAELQSRSVFVKMASQLTNPVVLNGGELVDGQRIAAGYGELYSKDLHKPIPGIKSIDVGFLGGQKTIREATINWTCWSFDEIDRLTPHFLSPGQTVLLEWGWVYNKNTLINLPTFINSKNQIKKSAYTNYKNTIISANGDFDMMVGIIKNYNFTTRDDGGFDCQTIISGMGVNMLKNAELNKNATNSDISIVQELNGYKIKTSPMTIKLAVEQIDLYVKYKLSEKNFVGKTQKKYLKTIVEAPVPSSARYYNYIPNQFIIHYANNSGFGGFYNTPGQILETLDVWVQWGWFEDNILSKFTTKFSDDSAGVPEADFRSVEPYIDADGNELGTYEPTRIRNHPNFETIDVNKFIVPGQFKPFKRPKDAPTEIAGDNEYLHVLNRIVTENFQPFAPGSVIEETISYTNQEGDAFITPTMAANTLGVELEKRPVEDSDTISNSILKNRKNDLTLAQNQATKVLKRKPNGKIDRTTGYFRNLLINTKLLKQAFGVSDTDEYTTEAVDIDDAIEQLFPLLNQDINMWDLQIVNDETLTYRSKIIDANLVIPFPPANTPINNPFEKSKTSKSVYSDSDVTNNGVFYFPSWQPDSLVKGQSITSTIPSSMAMSIMYGAKAPVINTAGKSQPDASPEGTGTGQMFKDAVNPPVNNNLVSIIRKDGFEKYGYAIGSGNLHRKLERLGGIRSFGDDNLRAFFEDRNISETISQTQKEKIVAQEEQEEVMQDSKATTLEDSLDPSVPPPPPDRLAKLVPDFFNSLSKIKLPTGIPSTTQVEHPLMRLYSSKYDKNDKMKKPFIDSVNYNMQIAKVIKTETIVDSNKPIKMPIELELKIDGIGGIYPGNSYHSTYLPVRYQRECIFQAFDINHIVDSSGWTTTISGKMRSTVERTANVSTSTRTVNILDITDQANKTLAKASENQKEVVQAQVNSNVDTGGGSNNNQQISPGEGNYFK